MKDITASTTEAVTEIIEILDREIDTAISEVTLIVDGYWSEWEDEREGKFGTLSPRLRVRESKGTRSKAAELIWEKSTRHYSGKGVYRNYINKPKGKDKYSLTVLKKNCQDWEAPLVEKYENRFVMFRKHIRYLQEMKRKAIFVKREINK